MVLRPTDGAGVRLFVEPHVQLLTQEWGRPTPTESAGREWRRHLHLTPRHHHFHFHLPLHAAHN